MSIGMIATFFALLGFTDVERITNTWPIATRAIYSTRTEGIELDYWFTHDELGTHVVGTLAPKGARYDESMSLCCMLRDWDSKAEEIMQYVGGLA